FLYLEERPLTLDDMSEALGKSKTSMSNSVRSLLDLNLITRVWRKGVRKNLYEANTQLFKSFMNSYTTKWIDAINHQKDSLMEINKHLEIKKKKNESNEKLTIIDQHLNKIIEFHELIDK